jgi:hypothetical protein
MSIEHNPEKANGNGGYEHRDVNVAGVLYFLAGLLVFGLIAFLIADGLYRYMDKRFEAEQPPVNPLVTNAPVDTRNIPRNYPQEAFPNPKLEEDERGQLIGIRLKEEQTLATYGWIDQKAGTVRIPIERAMDLIAQRGLPTQANPCDNPNLGCSTSGAPTQKAEKKKGLKK